MGKRNKNKASSKSSAGKSTQKAKSKPSQILKSFGSKISKKEIQKFERKAPKQDLKKIVKYASKRDDVKLKPGAKKYIKGKGVDPKVDRSSSPGGGGNDQPDGGGFIERIKEIQESLANITGGFDVKVAQIGADATTESARLRSEADKYISDNEFKGVDISSSRSLEGLKYGADKESEWRKAVANIEVKGRLDLQPIINAGLEKVAGIEAQAQRDVADITGRYDVEGIRVRGEADKQIGGMQLAGSMYNLINSAFG